MKATIEFTARVRVDLGEITEEQKEKIVPEEEQRKQLRELLRDELDASEVEILEYKVSME